MNYKQINEYLRNNNEMDAAWVWKMPSGIRKIECDKRVPHDANADWGAGLYI